MQRSSLKPIYRLTTSDVLRTVTSQSSSVKWDNLKSWKDIPGPSSLPFLGQLHNFFRGGAKQKLFDKYGLIVRFDATLGLEPTILLGDPETSAYVLRSENRHPKRPGFKSLVHYRHSYKKKKEHHVGCTGLLTEHGDVWKKFRSAVNPMFQPKTTKLYTKVLDEIAVDMVKRLKADRDENNMIRRKFDTEMNLWALESIATVALGWRMNSLDDTLAEDSPEKQLLQCIHDIFITVDQLDFKPNLWEYFATPQYKKAMKLYEHHELLIKYFVKKGIELIENADTKYYEKGILEKLVEIDEEYAYTMANDMLLAGVDTVANTTIGMLYLLAINQDKQDKLREEMLSNADQKYLKACLKEALRIMPVVSATFRRTTKEYNLLGYRIPVGMNIACCHRNMSLMEDHYLRASEYIPERWIVDKNDPIHYGNAHPFAYSPFGFGIRGCIGRRIAELEIETFVTRIIQNFKVKWFGPPPQLIRKSLVYIKGPFNFIFSDVK